jgi:hypothetical protein
MNSALRICLLLSVISVIAACGGGGGGGGSGSATASISASPTTIDTGDVINTRVEVGDADDNGIIVKIRMPSGLGYVKDSATLKVDGKESRRTPNFNVTASGFRYVVFFLSKASLGKGNFGEINLQFEGVKAVTSGEIALDVDLNNPLIPNEIEFIAARPEFTAEEQIGIRVRG